MTDDNEPITPGWLTALGFERIGPNGTLLLLDDAAGRFGVRVSRYNGDPGKWLVGGQNSDPYVTVSADVRTRGDVRRVLVCLCVPCPTV